MQLFNSFKKDESFLWAGPGVKFKEKRTVGEDLTIGDFAEQSQTNKKWYKLRSKNNPDNLNKTHELKTLPIFFSDVKSTIKNFEIRKNDRPFRMGDLLILREWDQRNENYTGRTLKRTIIYVLDSFPGIETGYVILGLSY